LVDTRNLHQDALQRENIAAQVREHIDSVTAVLVLANGTVPRVNVGTDYALSTLSAIFPRMPFKNIAFVLTNTSNALCQNFSGDIPPDGFKHAPQFLLNNPIALQRRYLKLKGDSRTKWQKAYFRKAVKASEQDALEMLVDLFDWLDGLEPQPITKVGSLHERIQSIVAKVTGTLAQQVKELRRAVKNKVEAAIRKVYRKSTS